MTDLKASSGDEEAGLGPIAQAVSKIAFDRIVLISDHPEGKSRKYSEWLRKFSGAEIEISDRHLSSPTNYGEIYETARDVLNGIRKSFPDSEWTFHLSP
ncbi:MAG: AAA family ATPase, partial [Lentisphaerota bacterium]